ncbi:MAG: DRTGG domain-containing protein [Oscillospiraceae bacterium]|nr:DRTGG domain-containing protein [Oscillospiraceae bacterium]
MTAGELAAHLHLACLTGKGGLNQPVNGCYIGDLLSHALTRLEHGNIWVTIHGHPNVVAVGVQTNAGCVILADGRPLDPVAAVKADEHNLPILASQKSAFALAGEVFQLTVDS